MTILITIVDDLHRTRAKARLDCPLILNFPEKEVGIYLSPWQIYKINHELCPAPRKEKCPLGGKCGFLDRITRKEGLFYYFHMSVVFYSPDPKGWEIKNISELSIDKMMYYFDGRRKDETERRRNERKKGKRRTIKKY